MYGVRNTSTVLVKYTMKMQLKNPDLHTLHYSHSPRTSRTTQQHAKKSGLNTATGPHMRSSFTFSFKPISTLLLPQNAAGQYRSSSNALDREPLIYLFFAVRCLLDRRKASSFWTSSSSRDRRFFALGTVTCFVPPRWSKASLTVSGSFPFFLSVPGSPRAFGVAGSVGSCGAHATFFP